MKVLSLFFIFFSTAIYAESFKLYKPEKLGFSSDRLGQISVEMDSFVKRKDISGAITLVARDGKIVYFDSKGYRNIEKKLPMNKDSILRMYSMTKLVTGVAVMILFEEGKFLLTDPISLFLNEFKDSRVYVDYKDGLILSKPTKQITIKDLLTHTSGIIYPFAMKHPLSDKYIERGISQGGHDITPLNNLDDWSKALASMPLITEPGTGWYYGLNMDLLGRLVEVVSGLKFSDFLQERIFEPLEMVDTGFHVKDSNKDRFSNNYMFIDNALVLVDDASKSQYLNPPALEMGGSGLVGTVSDFYKFGQMLLNFGNFDGNQILGRKTVELMVSNHLEDLVLPNNSKNFNPFQIGEFDSAYGMGLTGYHLLYPARAGRMASEGTFGWGGAAGTYLQLDFEEKILFMVNTQRMTNPQFPYWHGRFRQTFENLTYQAILN